jgi:cysteine-rich repeat protein
VDTDACPSTCELAFCGDGFVQEGLEECDDGDDDATDECLPVFCEAAACGDGTLWAGEEECDDGNLEDDDACPSSCADAFCGDGFLWTDMEACDDGNDMADDGCTDCQTDWPRLVAGEMVDAATVRLTFSEAIADVGAIDPDKFRIASCGHYVNGDATWYIDPGAYFAQPSVVVTSLTNDQNDATRVVAQLSGTVAQICMSMSYWEQDQSYSGVALYMSYTSMGMPDVIDLAQVELQDIAAHWAEDPQSAFVTVQGDFAGMPEGPVPMDCP